MSLTNSPTGQSAAPPTDNFQAPQLALALRTAANDQTRNSLDWKAMMSLSYYGIRKHRSQADKSVAKGTKMKAKITQFLGLIIVALSAMAIGAVAVRKSKPAKGSAKRCRPEITAEEANVLVSRFDLAGWNAGGEDFESNATKKAARV